VLSIVYAQNTHLSVDKIHFIDAARILRDPPERGQWLVKQLE
jgi:hypothetical protein